MTRQARQLKILELISENEIETQNDLLDELSSLGFSVTQATISRDIQDLGLTKVTSKSTGKAHYIKPLDPKLTRLKTLFHQTVIHIEGINNLIVIKTITGGADSACILIDKLDHHEIAGTIAGDDTILVIVRNEKEVKNIVRQFELLME